MQPAGQRPSGVIVLAILAILIGLVGVVGGAVLLISSNTLVAALSGFTVIVGLLYVATGAGFLQGARWAWITGLAVGILSLVRNIIEGIQGEIVFAIPGMVVAVLIIVYLNRPEVKAYFGRGTGATGG